MRRNKNFSDNKPLLYLIATPIGNIADMSTRGLELINKCDIVACEDTRNTKMLLSHYNLDKNQHHDFVSLREHNETETSFYLIDKMKEGKKVIYVSDAGYPGISDPGQKLVKHTLENEINVSVIPGPSASLTALVGSGLPTDHFYFYGFLPSRPIEAEKEIKELKNIKDTLILYESPHRIQNTLSLLFKILGNRDIVIARELTKINEEFIYCSLKEAKQLDEYSLRGEMVLIIDGNKENIKLDEQEIESRIHYFKNLHISSKDLADILTYEFKIKKNVAKDLINKYR